MAKVEVTESPNSLSNIISGTEIKGDIRSSANIRFDGILQGNLHTEARVVLGASSEVYGTIYCRHADIFGKVEGRIFAEELTMRSTAILKGNITARKVQLEPGCQFNGQCTMQDEINALAEIEKSEDHKKPEKLGKPLKKEKSEQLEECEQTEKQENSPVSLSLSFNE